MKHARKTERTVHAMVEDLISATVAATGYPASHVRQFIEASMKYMLREYGGDRLPKITRTFPVESIVLAVESGTPKREVCKEFGIGMSTLYRVLLTHKASLVRENRADVPFSEISVTPPPGNPRHS